ncbi:unnamed protein product, partial [Meganyctiphanes norvegica]
KLFKDKRLNWSDAKSHCESHGLILAEPSDAVALVMRNYLVENQGLNNDVWLGGKADGSKFVWQDGGKTLRNDSPLWHPNRSPGSQTEYTATKYCLMFMDDDYPGTSYIPSHCSSTEYPLCEAK